MDGSTRFRLVYGQTQQYGKLTFPATLALSDADADAGTRPRGRAMAIDPTNELNMTDADGTNFLGFLMNDVDLYGTTGDKGFKEFSLGYPDMAVKRGSKVSLIIPELWSVWEFEGPDGYASGVDSFLYTENAGTGEITTSTAADTLLSFDANGCIYVAQTADVAFMKMLKADVTPINTGEIRIRVQFVPTYTVPA
jgi:hypothetical protein